jgi:hypothetical protein
MGGILATHIFRDGEPVQSAVKVLLMSAGGERHMNDGADLFMPENISYKTQQG